MIGVGTSSKQNISCVKHENKTTVLYIRRIPILQANNIDTTVIAVATKKAFQYLDSAHFSEAGLHLH